jgi:predicted peroxiredoxin
MYGGSGSGGTLSSGSGGGAAGGSAPVSENAAGQIGMGLMQMQQIQSTTELNKALANKANAEAAKTSGIDTEIGGANKALIEMNTKNAEVQNQLNSRSLEDSLDTIKANRDTAVANSATASTQADVNATTKQAQIDEINAKAINEAFKLAVAKSGINLNEAQMNKMLEDVKIGKANAEKIGIDQVAGKQLNSLIEKIYDMFGVKNETIK